MEKKSFISQQLKMVTQQLKISNQDQNPGLLPEKGLSVSNVPNPYMQGPGPGGDRGLESSHVFLQREMKLEKCKCSRDAKLLQEAEEFSQILLSKCSKLSCLSQVCTVCSLGSKESAIEGCEVFGSLQISTIAAVGEAGVIGVNFELLLFHASGSLYYLPIKQSLIFKNQTLSAQIWINHNQSILTPSHHWSNHDLLFLLFLFVFNNVISLSEPNTQLGNSLRIPVLSSPSHFLISLPAFT